ncbi:hypothetical protein [Sphingomonas hengshuiensis]|uniref:hypothetical protein n=1 Tax=Sphingomonas hengshuiensis TaxID=1609977 RepID=UPI000696EA6E|nr:hypothetical protein [Sphingomonas hengshuiensis]
MEATKRTLVPEWLRNVFGRRGAAFVLALLVELLIALLLLWMSPTLPGKKDAAGPTVFGINVDGDKPSEKAEAAKEASKRAAPREVAPVTPPPPPEIVPPPPPVPNTANPMPFIRMTRRDYADADIAKAKSGAPAAAGDSSAESGDAAGAMAGDSEAIGTAPNGEPLYPVEWYRRPTHAQLDPYRSPRSRGPGFGLIACRTIARYQVTDCQELGEGPRGSGNAGAVRQAAFQFLVVPPRKGGKPLIGTWVAIRIDYIEQPASPPK